MIQLRHLKTNVSATLPETCKKISKEGEKLQTLGTISPKSCTEEFFDRARNLKKLSIGGRLALLLDGKNESFHVLKKLVNLEKLKLVNDAYLEGQLPGLPPPYNFPPNLRTLTLSNTFLGWSHMSILGSLLNLEVLKLKDNAFVGRSWKAADEGFHHLEVLHIGRTDLVLWLTSAQQFPKLRRLELWNCETLKEVPSELANIQTLELLQLYNSTRSAAASAKKIREAKEKMKQLGQTANDAVFKLSIFPDDE